ncbi:MAG: ABC transporter permease [Gemmatimonadaceae bacterium]|nr:ABC transporter permease [Gemmatimonadaceae bacterium]
MRTLKRKLLRDAWHYRGQMGAIAAVVACGIATFVALRSMHGHLRHSRDAYYASSRFADVFVSLRRAPLQSLERLRAIRGVAAVDARVVMEVVADVPRLAEPAVVRLVSIPVPRTTALNEVHLTAGRWPEPSRDDEVIASRAFATANALSLGDSVGVVLNGRRRWLRLVGVGVSPEYVYEIASGGLFPDNRRFGILWMARGALAAPFDLVGAFNDLALALAPGAAVAPVLERVDTLLAPFGTGGAYARADQVSSQFLDGEIDETQVTSILLPAIFLAVTAFLLHVVLSRLVNMQREQIATLKAFGFSNVTVAQHYLLLAMVPVLAGVVAGTVFGLWSAGQLALVYARFYQFPAAAFTPDWSIVLAAAAIGVVSGLLGALGAVMRGVALPPAEAMRPEAPARFRRGSLERALSWVTKSPRHLVVARNLERRPGRTMLSILGLALAGGLVIATQGLFDSVDYIKLQQFHVVDRGDVTVTFREPLREEGVREVARAVGVQEAEGFRMVPARLRHHERSYRTAIVAFPPHAALRRVVDIDGTIRQVPSEGILLSSALAEKLGARRGDALQLEFLEGERRVARVEVSGTNDDMLGTAAYMAPAALQRLEGGTPVFTGVVLRADPRRIDSLYRHLKAMPVVSGVSVRSAMLGSFERTIAESFSISLAFTLGFACVIAAGIVYNGARVALSERGREMASLRILGFTRGEVSGMLTGEQGALTVASFPVAFAVAYLLTWLIAVRFESALFRIPVVARPATYLFGAGVIAMAAALSAVAVRRRVDRLDLVAVLKTRE